MEVMQLTWHADPGHEWLYVGPEQLERLDLSEHSFSRFSFVDADGGIYAEGDCDAGIVINAARGADVTLTYSEQHSDRDAPCRNMPRCGEWRAA